MQLGIALTSFDYQSERHCSKTKMLQGRAVSGLITSQNVTAPKQADEAHAKLFRLITRQNVTAPKPLVSAELVS